MKGEYNPVLPARRPRYEIRTLWTSSARKADTVSEQDSEIAAMLSDDWEIIYTGLVPTANGWVIVTRLRREVANA